MEEYERQNGPLHWNDNWLRDVQGAYQSDRLRRAFALPNAARRPAQGSIHRARTQSTAVRAGAAGDRRRGRLRSSRTRSFMCTRTMSNRAGGPAPAVLLCHMTPRGLPTRRLRVLQHARHSMAQTVGTPRLRPSEVSH